MKDLISRKALKNTLTDWQMEYAEKEKDTERFETLGAALDLVAGFPSVDVSDRKVGKWKDVEAEEGEWICFKCSECGHDAYSYTVEILLNEWKFCPYCGAMMERSKE